MPMEIRDRRAEVEAEGGDVAERQSAPLVLVLDQVGEGCARQRLEHDDRLRPLQHLVGADDVRMRHALEQASFPIEAPARLRLAQPIGPNDLGDALARTLLAPDFVDVERLSATEMPENVVS